MKQKTIAWNDATRADLVKFCSQALGIPTHPSIGEDALRSKIRQAYEGDTITILVLDGEEPLPPADAPVSALASPPSPQSPVAPVTEPEQGAPVDQGAPQKVAAKVDEYDNPVQDRALRGHSSQNDPKVKVTIAEETGAGGRRGVFVGVNGVGMIIPRARPVDIPYRYWLVLNNARKTVYEQDDETGEIMESTVLSYPVSVNQMPSQEEIDAYYAADAGRTALAS